MSNFKYKTAESVRDAISEGSLKRNSGMVIKRQQKKLGNLDNEKVMEDGIALYDDLQRDLLTCSYYKKSINTLSLYELVELESSRPELFSYYHKVRYSMLMLGEVGSVDEYRGMVVTPDEIKNL